MRTTGDGRSVEAVGAVAVEVGVAGAVAADRVVQRRELNVQPRVAPSGRVMGWPPPYASGYANCWVRNVILGGSAALA